MSSRALRKAQREREEQERVKRLEQEDIEEIEEDGGPAQSAKMSAFAMLGDEDNEEDEENTQGGYEIDQREEPEETVPSSTTKTSGKKKRRKKKGKSSGATPSKEPAGNGDDNMDEIDKALKQLSTNGDASLTASTAAGVNRETEELCKLLAVETSHLHAQNEMRRLFGRAALEHQADDEQPANAANVGGNRRQQRRVQQVGLAQALRGQAQGGRGSGLAAMALRRNIFIHGKEEWPNSTGGGLGMEIEEKKADGTVLYRFVHNRAYQDVQSQFAIAVESMDPNRLIIMLQQYPYHISTLLQVSEIAKQERDHAVAGDLLERALFSFGRAVHSSFAKLLAEGKARLDFRRPENREFWLASWRYMQNLSMRATWRTVYEWAKLLLSLSPDDDPYAIWLALDQYALRARQDLDFVNLSRGPAFKSRLKNTPNVQLSQGLAEFRAGNPGKGKQTLFTAVGRYPWVVARLMRELNIDPLPPAIWGKEPRTEKEKFDSELYATRAKDLWNTPEASALLLEVASALPPDTPSAHVDTEADIKENEARHILLSDVPALIALIPREYTARLQSTSDPLPPHDSYPSTSSISPSDTIESIERELTSIFTFLDSVLPERELHMLSAEDVNRMVEEAGPEQGRRIVESIRRMDGLQRRLVTLQRGQRGDGGGGGPVESESEDDDDSTGSLRARVDDAPDEDG